MTPIRQPGRCAVKNYSQIFFTDKLSQKNKSRTPKKMRAQKSVVMFYCSLAAAIWPSAAQLVTISYHRTSQRRSRCGMPRRRRRVARGGAAARLLAAGAAAALAALAAAAVAQPAPHCPAYDDGRRFSCGLADPPRPAPRSAAGTETCSRPLCGDGRRGVCCA